MDFTGVKTISSPFLVGQAAEPSTHCFLAHQPARLDLAKRMCLDRVAEVPGRPGIPGWKTHGFLGWIHASQGRLIQATRKNAHGSSRRILWGWVSWVVTTTDWFQQTLPFQDSIAVLSSILNHNSYFLVCFKAGLDETETGTIMNGTWYWFLKSKILILSNYVLSWRTLRSPHNDISTWYEG